MKKKLALLFILIFSAIAEEASQTPKTPDDLFQICSSREELEALTGVPASGIEIEKLDRIVYPDQETTVIAVICQRPKKTR